MGEYVTLNEAEPTKEQRILLQINYEMAPRLFCKPYMYDRNLPWMLPSQRVPTLIAWGRQDRFMLLECVAFYQQAFPDARA